MSANKPLLQDAVVAVAKTGSPDYAADGYDRIWRALLQASKGLGWFEEGRGPFAQLISPGSRVLIKPNLVHHKNHAPFGLASMLTHRTVIEGAFKAACLAGAKEIVIGDAPIQGCDFAAMLQATGLDEWSLRAKDAFPSFTGIHDFRRGMSSANALSRAPNTESFTVFDLASSSLLEPVTYPDARFRVTCYDPRLLRAAHKPGRHAYLVASRVLESDVVINLPKLKMHQKAGISCAQKNIVGICSHKASLPHHRLGGSFERGDCYPGSNQGKAMLEYAFDRENTSRSFAGSMLWRSASRLLDATIGLWGDQIGAEGSWSGNDTVWRMCLDLNRILLYGRVDGTLANEPQRTVIHLVDAVIAGQGKGPLSPEPLPLGLLLLGQNGVAVDWVGALLLGYDAYKVALTRNAFSVSPCALANFAPSDVSLLGDLGCGRADSLLPAAAPVMATHYPAGWTDAKLLARRLRVSHECFEPSQASAEDTAFDFSE